MKPVLKCLILILATSFLWPTGVGVAFCANQQKALEIPEGGASMLPQDPMEAIYWYPRGESSVAKSEIVEVQDMPFHRAIRTTTCRETPVAWDVGAGVNLSETIDAGDSCLLSFYVRGTRLQGKSGSAKADAYLEFTRSPHEKLVTMAVSADRDWRRIYIPFRAETALRENKVRVVFHLGFLPQTVEIGGISLLNFRKKVSLAALPATRLTYRGREPDAPWRKDALDRIERIRKADFAVNVVDAAGKPVRDATVQIRMRRHAFEFGSAVTAKLLGVNTEDAETIRKYFKDYGGVESILTYRKIVETLFNKTTFENDLKIIPWNDSQSNRSSVYRKDWTDRALNWLNRRDIKVRGHWIACGFLDELPPEIMHAPKHQVRTYLFANMRQRVKSVGDRIKEWDAINHIVGSGETLETLFGSPDIYVDIMKESKKLAPEASLWVNEGFILPDGRRRDPYERVIRYLIDHDAAPDGIGFMGHFDRLSLTPPDELTEVFDRFARLIPRLQVTELDVDVGDDEQLQADYLRDAMTVAFSNEACRGIVIWGFWENRIYKPSAELYRSDWSLKPAGAMWRDLVFRQWWTDVHGSTDRNGVYKQRGFLGQYEITATMNERSVAVNAVLPKEGAAVKITLP
ncbi:MAG: endo-1,4-beta-xylanase [Desulfomonilaceae bacterium]